MLIDNGIWKDFVHLIHKQTNYRQICLFYISWLNYTLSKMILAVILLFQSPTWSYHSLLSPGAAFFAIINTRNYLRQLHACVVTSQCHI